MSRAPFVSVGWYGGWYYRGSVEVKLPLLLHICFYTVSSTSTSTTVERSTSVRSLSLAAVTWSAPTTTVQQLAVWIAGARWWTTHGLYEIFFFFSCYVLFYITLSYDDWESDSERWTTSPRPHVSFFFVFLAFYFFLTMFYRLLSAQWWITEI